MVVFVCFGGILNYILACAIFNQNLSKCINMHTQKILMYTYVYVYILITTCCNSSTYCKHQNQKTYTWLEGPLALAQLVIVEKNLSRLDPSWKRTTTLFSKHSNVRWTIWSMLLCYMLLCSCIFYSRIKDFPWAILVDLRASLPNPKHHIKGTPPTVHPGRRFEWSQWSCNWTARLGGYRVGSQNRGVDSCKR